MTNQPNITEQLVSLACGELSHDQAGELRARIEREPELRAAYERLAQTVGFLKAEPAAEPSVSVIKSVKKLLRESRPGAMERLAEGLRRVVASLDFDTRLTPAVAGIRGAAAAAQVAFSCDDADIDLEITQSDDATWHVAAQIDADESEQDWSVTIVDRASDASVVNLDARDGAFRADLGAGSYTLRLRRDDLEIEVGPLQIP